MAVLKQVHGNFSDQLFKRMFRNVQEFTKEQMLQNMFYMACDMLSTAYEIHDFISVTGNLINSFAVGIYYKGELQQIVGAANMGIPDAKRRSLAKGQKYPISKWYDAVEPYAGTSKVPVFVGEVGGGNVSGREAAINKLKSTHPWKRDTYAVIMVAPMVYADWIQSMYGHDVLTGVRDAMPILTKTLYI